MSVIDYVFVCKEQDCRAEHVIKKALAIDADMTVVEQKTSRNTLGWKWLILTSTNTPHLQHTFEIVRASRSDFSELENLYSNPRITSLARQASKKIVCQLQTSDARRHAWQALTSKRREAELLQAEGTYNSLLLALLKLGQGVLDRPESSQLFTSRAFAKYLQSLPGN